MNLFKFTVTLMNGATEKGFRNGKDAAAVRVSLRRQLAGFDVSKIEVRKHIR